MIVQFRNRQGGTPPLAADGAAVQRVRPQRRLGGEDLRVAGQGEVALVADAAQATQAREGARRRQPACVRSSGTRIRVYTEE